MSQNNHRKVLIRTMALIVAIIITAAAIICFDNFSTIFSDLSGCTSITSYSDTSATDIISNADAETDVIIEEPDVATLMFGGDILIHKSVYSRAKTGDNTYDFTPYVEFFDDVFVSDYNSVNLESPVDAYGNNKSISTYPRFNAPLELLDALKRINIDFCTNSNNHMIDQGYDGLLATIKHLDEYGFDHAGTYASQESHDEPCIREINGIKVGFLIYTQTTNMLKLSDSLEAYAFDRISYKEDEIAEVILPRANELREAGAEILIAVLHWGIEYNDFPSNAQKRVARVLCEGGVDIIIGSHPHVVQPIEKLTFTNADGTTRDCLVAYSLGNLLCNQSTLSEYTQRGMVVAIKLERGDDGIARFTDAFYVPTLLQIVGKSGGNFMRLVTPGRYIDGQNIPELLASDSNFKNRCRITWNYVTKIAGDAIPAVTDPANYPEGFFSDTDTEA